MSAGLARGLVPAACLFLVACGGEGTSSNADLITTQAEFSKAVESAQAGDTLVLANGEWKDFEILFTGQGRADKPISLTAETKGEVILTGQSNLRLAGEYLNVSGLVFRDGYTPTSSVIEFRQSKDELANNSSVSEVVIDSFNSPERYETSSWVMMYGRNNRFERNHLAGKGNQGVTMAVRMNTEASHENAHVISGNYFGPRDILGSNGGETLRIGTSHYSLSDSMTEVSGNVFDRCDGEVEIISVKSGRNVLRGNTFLKSRGTLTLRHGNNNLIEDNVFLGEGVDHTGGLRIINGGQTVRNNYLEGLTGIRFGGAFVVMNGVPDSPINRYHQVRDAVMENNSIIDSDNIQLGAGSDSERSAVPVNSVFRNSLVAPKNGQNVFTVYDDMSGIDFSENVVANADAPDFTSGFAKRDIKLERAENGLLYPVSTDITAGVSRDLTVTKLEDVGVDWYPKTPQILKFGSGAVINVPAEQGALFTALKDVQPGDTLKLAPGEHHVRKLLELEVPVTFAGADARLTFERPALFQINNGGSLRLEGLNISGREAPDMTGNALIRTSPYSMTKNYRVEIVDTVVEDLDVNRFFDVMRGAKSTMADHISVEGSEFRNISGSVFKLDAESDDYGRYNTEYLNISDSIFENVEGPLAALYRGGRDESTFGPHFSLTGSTLSNVGAGSRNTLKTSLWLHGVQATDISDNEFLDSPAFKIDHTVAEPQTVISGNRFENTKAPVVVELTSGMAPTARLSNNEGL